jgi:hypothetical protein
MASSARAAEDIGALRKTRRHRKTSLEKLNR